MLRQCCVFLVLFSQLGLTFPNSMTKYGNRSNVVRDVLATLFGKCELGLKNVIIFDSSRNPVMFDNFNSSIGQRLITGFSPNDKNGPQDIIDTQGFIGIFDDERAWRITQGYLMFEWKCNVNCTTILISQPGMSCIEIDRRFKFLYHAGFRKAFYVCLENPVMPIVFTSVGHTNITRHLPYWRPYKSTRTFNHILTIFHRPLWDRSFCRGFNFDRTLLDISQATVGVFVTVNDKRQQKILFGDGKIFKNDIRLSLHYERASALQRLLNIDFQYVYVYARSDHQHHNILKQILNASPVNVVVNPTLIKSGSDFIDYSYPTSFEEYAIISRHQGIATPLERIATFYGFWTLLSLTILLVLTFIVIWHKTGRNVTFAAFDIIRLLINSGVNVPLDTLSIKIFFCMIFLYFMIIHALFSGHIAEFLTVPAPRKNIDSVEDLKIPRIKTIYNLGYTYDDIDDAELLKKKTVQINDISRCIEMVIDNPDAACIGPRDLYRSVIHDSKLDEKLHISKSQFLPTIAVLPYAKRFPLREKFDWALMAMSETRVFNRMLELKQANITASETIKKVRSQVDYRPIRLSDLKFAFIFLIIGHSLATVCFLIELVVGRKKKKVTTELNKPKKRSNCKKTVKTRKILVKECRTE